MVPNPYAILPVEEIIPVADRTINYKTHILEFGMDIVGSGPMKVQFTKKCVFLLDSPKGISGPVVSLEVTVTGPVS